MLLAGNMRYYNSIVDVTLSNKQIVVITLMHNNVGGCTRYLNKFNFNLSKKCKYYFLVTAVL